MSYIQRGFSTETVIMTTTDVDAPLDAPGLQQVVPGRPHGDKPRAALIDAPTR
jgi:hypothetical protein